MYIHIGKNICLKNEDVVGIFNLDYIRNTKEYRNFLSNMEEKKQIENIAKNEEKTFILIQNKDYIKGYITNIGANTIAKRMKNKLI